ncbi:MAG: phage tail tape measure protein [Flavobacteriales bacterium]
MANKVERRGIKIYIDDKELKQSYHNLRREYKKQLGILNKLDEAHPDYRKKAAEVAILKKRFEELNQSQRKLISGGKETKGVFGKFSGMFSGIKGMVAGAFAVGSVVAWGKQLYDNITVLRETKHEIKTLTGLTGKALNDVTAKTKAITGTYNKDVKDTVKTANALSKHFGLTMDASLKLIEKGLLAGADASGDMYNQLSEYAPLMKEAKLSADEFVSLIAETEKASVFNDKGVDAIKEGFISLREGTKGTKDAIAGLGINVDDMYTKIESGNLSYFEALKLISKELEKTGNKSTKTGTAIADIFRGAGEDAGFEFLANLHKMNTELEKSIDTSDEYARLKQRELEINEDLNKIWVSLTGTGSALNSMYLSVKSGLVDVLGSLSGVKTEAISANEAFEDQARKVVSLNQNLSPLVAEYDVLKSKSKLSKDEHLRLKKVVGEIGSILPSAVTSWDKYGNAVSVSTSRVTESIEKQKLILKYKNQEAIEAETEAIEENTRKLKRYQKLLKTFASEEYKNTPTHYGAKNVSDKTIQGVADEVKRLNDLIAGSKAYLERLTGDYLDEFVKKEKGATKATSEELKKRENLEILANKYKIKFTKATSDEQIRNLISAKRTEIERLNALKKANKTKLDAEKKNKKKKAQEALSQKRKQSISELNQELQNVKQAQEEIINQKLAMMQDGYEKEIDIENTNHSRRLVRLNDQKKDLDSIKDAELLETAKRYNDAIDAQIEAENKLHNLKKQAITQKHSANTVNEAESGWSDSIDVLGLSPEQWEAVMGKLDENGEALMSWGERVQGILQGVGTAWASYYDYLNNREAQELKAFTKSTNDKKDKLKDRYDKGLIDKESYDKQVSKLDKDLEKQQAIAEYNRAKREKTMSLFQIASNTAVGIMKAVSASFATGGMPWSGIIAAMGLAQAGLVAAAPLPDKGFYYGGFTGSEGSQKDQYGTITGYVHDNEYVVPKVELEDPAVRSMVDLIEQKRTGYTDSITNNSGSSNTEMMALISSTNALMNHIIEHGVESTVAWDYNDTRKLTKQQTKLNRLKNNG